MTRPMNTYRMVAVLLTAVALAACDKNAVQQLPLEPLLESRIKFFHYGVNAPTVNFYAATRKMTAVTPETPGQGVAFPNPGSGGAYSTIAAGHYTLAARISSGADIDLPIASVDTTIAAGKFYTFYMSGIYNAVGKTADAFVVEDAYPSQVDYVVAQVRFVHAISNAAPLTLYAANTTTTDTVTVGRAVRYKSAGAFIGLPAGVYNLFARYTDSTTNKITRTAVSFVGGRVYTVGARGDITITSTAAANRPFLDNTTNR